MNCGNVERPSGRGFDEMRTISFERSYTCHAEGSVMASFGNTKVLCNVSITPGVPSFLRGSKQGWLTAEYGMLPRSTDTRMAREASRGKQTGRTVEIQRLIGRSLRASLDLKKLGDWTITVDCDVLQADGGTRTTAISGSCVALVDALNKLQLQGQLTHEPFKTLICAVSVGIWRGKAVVDLDYIEDSAADSDVNIVMTSDGDLIEVQGTAEGNAFSREQFNSLLDLATNACKKIAHVQRDVLTP